MPVVRIKPSVRMTPDGMTVNNTTTDIAIDKDTLTMGNSVTVTK